ncbi:hypothetical protein BVRB_015250 isoform A, partial [Beta vulgaris subsp. vulgaris]
PKVPPHESEPPPPPFQEADVPVPPEHKPLVTPGAVAETGFPL